MRLAHIIALSTVVALSSAAYAYVEEGHYYSVASLGQEPLPAAIVNSKQIALIALCAQIPDLSKELDAVTLKFDSTFRFSLGGWLWGGFGSCYDNEIRHMVAVHHYLHALTGAPVADTEIAARRTFLHLRAAWSHDQSPKNACALGLAIHLYGDAHAHQDLRKPDHMYEAGMGHFRDDILPDLLAYPGRPDKWKEYVNNLGDLLQIGPSLHRADLLKIPYPYLDKAGSRGNRYFESNILDDLNKLASTSNPSWEKLKPPVENYSHDLRQETSFDKVMSDYFPKLESPPKFVDVWSAFHEAAKQEFTNKSSSFPTKGDDKFSPIVPACDE
jgi:hypothetical protein